MRIVRPSRPRLRLLRPALFAALLSAALAVAGPGSATAAAPKPAPLKYTEVLMELEHPKGLWRFARSVSDPGSPRYQRYRPVKWIVKRYGAPGKAKRAARRFLAKRGIRGRMDASGTVMLAKASFREAARLAPGASVSSARGSSVPVPEELSPYVGSITVKRAVAGLYHPAAAAAASGPTAAAVGQQTQSSGRPLSGSPAGCEAGVAAGGWTPNQYTQAYGHADFHRRGLTGQGMKMAVVEIDGFARENLDAFGSCFGLRIPPTPIKTIGTKAPLDPGGETNLDLQVISAAAPGLKKIDVYESGPADLDLIFTMGAALGAPGNRPDVVSMSIGTCEPDFVAQLAQITATNNILAVAAGAGISFLVSSGDTGSTACAYAGNTDAAPVIAVNSPASSPWATAVGGTNFELDAANRIVHQVTWNHSPDGPGASGGGASILSKESPWYQSGKVFQGIGGPARYVPDIAALADQTPGYTIYQGGWTRTGGTSAATPLMAAGIALINQQAKKQGRKPIGFLNPLLYRLGKHAASKSVFYDVTEGTNSLALSFFPELVSAGEISTQLWPAGPGWDPATGWGSPYLDELAKAARELAAGPAGKKGGKKGGGR